jgi:hypothetical protein
LTKPSKLAGSVCSFPEPMSIVNDDAESDTANLVRAGSNESSAL